MHFDLAVMCILPVGQLKLLTLTNKGYTSELYILWDTLKLAIASALPINKSKSDDLVETSR